MLLLLFPHEDEIIFEQFDMEGHSKKGVKRAIDNTTIIKIRTFNF
jgi:hypothetical protein